MARAPDAGRRRGQPARVHAPRVGDRARGALPRHPAVGRRRARALRRGQARARVARLAAHAGLRGRQDRRHQRDRGPLG